MLYEYRQPPWSNILSVSVADRIVETSLKTK